MTEAAGIFEQVVSFDPTVDFDAFLKQVPAKGAVYLLADEADLPVQLLCVKNLRVSLKRRLGPPEPGALPSKRIDYRDLVRRIHFRRIDSDFEADWTYYEAARRLFPKTYQGMVGFRPAWFVHIDPAATFPRYTKTVDISGRTGVHLGPLEDKHAAARLMELVEDAFDLCRYYHILVEAPHGKACAYKEMGKCPAPCDGSVSMESYRKVVDWSLRTLIDPRPLIRDQESRMKAAAAELRFESAAKIKQHIEQLSQLGKGPFRHLRPLPDFRYLCLQHGPKTGSAKVFVVTPGSIDHIASLIDAPVTAPSLLRLVFEQAERPTPSPPSLEDTERIGVVSHHLFTAKSHHGVFLPLADVEDKTLARAYRDLMKQKRPEEFDGEGIVKELQGIE
ncbi:UvrB/UvrC motif-containing protein [Humisphaera borealis]|uniref:UvrB/UvrC motif-containing protein n=1 Tax=Humisphaera borealis TaxID=2807512 RepID=A0A7M2WWR6_9BACT|nr:UvrB/UvrC motif-containing protein [Humisphaera borealis]QOV89978.1 UvrB/UvrC motif-containing protein [Humisphaera borealis]